MTLQDRLTKARSSIVLDAPFFGSCLLKLPVLPDPAIPTFCTDGTRIRYNPEFADKLSDAELRGVLVHEVAHIVLGHLWRMEGRDPRAWNVATDYAINQVLDDYAQEARQNNRPVPWELPKDGLLDPAQRGKSSEEIYSQLPKPPPGGSGDGSGAGSSASAPSSGLPASSGEFESPQLSPGDQAQLEADWKIAVTQAAQAAKMCGNCPGAIRRLVEDLIAPRLPWRDLVRNFLRTLARDDYSWSRPNPRYAHTGFMLPSLRSERVLPIVLAIDTSGSIGPDDLQVFASEAQACLDEAQASEIIVLYCDTRINGEESRFRPGDRVTIDARGGGGTDFNPPFKWVDDNLEDPPAGFVYLTDGCASPPNAMPEYPVLWAIHGDHGDRFNPPFGDLCKIA
jgi:predicted metal-dependent peptidase